MRHLVWAVGAVSVFGLVNSAEAQIKRPDCDLRTGHFLVSSAVTYLSGASDQNDPVKRERMMNNALNVLNDAITRGQDDNPAVWYFYGRYYVMQNDPVGADSTFTIAEDLAPQCTEDISFYRQSLWVPTMNMAMDSMRVGAYDGAKALLHVAYAVWDQNNLTPFYLAGVFGGEPQLDSAVYYFKKVIDLGNADTTRVENYQTAMYNIGLIYGMMGEWDSSAVWYDRYRTEVNADDPEALKGLAEALDRSGQTDRALLLYDSIIGRAEDMKSLDLFWTGERLFLAEQYNKAADVFALGLEKNPYHRTALYNLANAYLAISNEDERPQEERDQAVAGMEATARRLLAVDPQSVESLNLLAAAFQLQSLDDSTLAVLERREALEFEVKIDVMQPAAGGYSVQGSLTSLAEAEISVPAIAFEFLDQVGNVLAVQTVDATSLAPMSSSTFSLTAEGEGIIAARYKVEG